MDYFLRELKAETTRLSQEPRETLVLLACPGTLLLLKKRRIWDCGSWNKLCVKGGRRKQKRTMTHCGLYTKGAKPSQQDLHEKVVIGGVFHLILLVLVFNLDCFTHMHVQGMFATEELGSLRVPPSDLNINNHGGKMIKVDWESLLCTSIKYHCLFVPIFCVIWAFE